MLFDFIAAAAAGFGIAGIAMLLRHLTRGLLPRWIVPLAAGVGMFGYAVWNEYSWFDRVTGAFAEGVEVVVAPTESQFYRPWTYIKPLTNWIWIGSALMALGGLLSLSDRRFRVGAGAAARRKEDDIAPVAAE